MNNMPKVKHYDRLTPEPIEIINLFNLSPNLTNVVKYLARAGHKDAEWRDIQKAIDYLNFELKYKTQRYIARRIKLIDLDTLWVDIKYREQIIYILKSTTMPNSRAVEEHESERLKKVVIELTDKLKRLNKKTADSMRNIENNINIETINLESLKSEMKRCIV